MKKILRKITGKFISPLLAKFNELYDSKDKNDLLFMIDKYINHSLIKAYNFDFTSFSDEVIAFAQSMKIEGENFSYRYAHSVPKTNLYNSLYVCLLHFLLSKQSLYSNNDLFSWGEYINSFQQEDGFYFDKNIETDQYYSIDWWGARHLSPHVIIALNYIGIKPKYEFNYIKKFYDNNE